MNVIDPLPILFVIGVMLMFLAYAMSVWPKPRPEPGKLKFVASSAGCMGCLVVAFYVVGIISSVISIIAALYRAFKG